MSNTDHRKTLLSQQCHSEDQIEDLPKKTHEGDTISSPESLQMEIDQDLNFNSGGRTSFSDAVRREQNELKQILFQAYTDIDPQVALTEFSPLIQFSPNDSNGPCLQLSGKNPDLDIWRRGETDPTEAMMFGSGKSVMILLPMKQNAKVKEDNGITGFHFPSVRGRSPWIERLLQLGPDPKDCGNDIRDFLHYAAHCGRMYSTQLPIGECNMIHYTNKGCPHVHDSFQTALGLSESEVTALRPNLEYCIRMYAHQDCFRNNNETVAQMIKGAVMLDLLSVNAQDENGNTILHEAVNEGHTEVVRTLLKCGALSTAINYQNETPSQLAQERNHTGIIQILESHISSLSKPGTVISSGEMDESETLIQRQTVRCEQYNTLLKLVEFPGFLTFKENDRQFCIAKVQEVADLLSSGSPLIPPAIKNTNVLHLVIFRKHTIPLHTLLAAGAPLMSCDRGLVHITCRNPDKPTPATFMFAKAVGDRLIAEMKFEPKDDLDKELIKEVENLTVTLRGEKPWLTKCPKEYGTAKLTQLLVRACSHGATNAAWWLRNAGGSTNIVDSSTGITALWSALYNHQYDTAADLIRHMGANPFLPDASGRFPIDHFPEEQKADIYLGCLAQESSSLARLYLQIHDGFTNREDDAKKLMLLLGVLFVTFQRGGNSMRYDTAELYTSSFKLMKILNTLYKNRYSSGIADVFWKLLAKLQKIYKYRKQSRKNLKNNRLSDSVLLDALKLCSEKKFPLFMHLLVTVREVNVNDEINKVCKTTALHHAAANGNLSAMSYLLSKGAILSARDRYGRSPLHYASFYGHNLTRKYLESHYGDGCGINEKCSLGRTPVDYCKAYNTYLRTSCIEIDSLAPNYNNEALIMKYHLKKLEKVWKTEGIIGAVRKALVNYEKGEAADIKDAVENSVQKLLSAVAAQNSHFEGKLQPSGSSAEGVRLFLPDEFDFNWVFTKMSGLEDGGLKVILKHLSTDQVDLEGHDRIFFIFPDNEEFRIFSGYGVLLEFMKLCKKCLAELEFSDSRLSLVPPGVKYKMVGVGLTLMWSGLHYPQLLIDVDLVPTIQAPWPKALNRAPLVPENVNVIYLSTSLVSHWRLSTGALEKLVLERLEGIQKDVFLACKMVLSTLKVPQWVVDDIKNQYRYFNERFMRIQVPNGFVLKSCFFRELEEMKDESDWQEDKLMDRIISIFRRMCCQEGSKYTAEEVYHYFTGAVISINSNGEQVISGSTDEPNLAEGAPKILEFLESFNESLKAT